MKEEKCRERQLLKEYCDATDTQASEAWPNEVHPEDMQLIAEQLTANLCQAAGARLNLKLHDADCELCNGVSK